MVDKTYREALADNELVPGAPGANETQITGLEVFGATTSTPFTDAGLTFNSLKGWIFADPDTMLKSVYDIDDDGIVDKSETIDDGAGNSKTAAQVAGHIDTPGIHAVLNDASTTINNLWSASKINTEVGAKADQSAFNAHVSDLSIHRALNDSVTNTTTLWSGFKIDSEVQTKADQTALDSHIGDLNIHRALNDAATTATNLWSASKINADISVKANITDLNAHITNTNNPHGTTHAQVAPGITYDHAAIDLHIPNNSHLTAAERAAFDNAPNPATGANPLATQADLIGDSRHVIQDEGVSLTARANLNFTGAGVTASDDSGNDATVVNITSGGDVVGPSGVTDSRLSLFDGTSGKLIKEGARLEADLLALPVDDQLSGLAQKLTPVGADILLLEDSESFGAKRRVPWSSLPTGGGGTGDVSGPGVSVDNQLALFDGTTGKQIKTSTLLEDWVLAWPSSDQYSNVPEELTPNAADTILIEETGLLGDKKRVPWSVLPSLTDVEFPTYAVFDAIVDKTGGGTIDFADGNKQVTDAQFNANIQVTAPSTHPANFMLTILQSNLLTSIAPLAGGQILWAGGTPPAWAGRADLALFYDGTNWIGSALVDVQ